MRLTRWSPQWILLIAVCLLSAPFLGKAVHIDERIYLEVAENILHKPLYPYDYPAIFEGFAAEDAASHSRLPLASYCLALLQVLAGEEKIWFFRLAFLIFPVLAALAFYDLAHQYLRHPLAAALIFVSSPAFLVLSHSLMTDVALLAFWCLSISRFLRLTQGPSRPADALVLALSLLGAAFISLQSAGLILLLGAVLVVRLTAGGVDRSKSLILAGILVLPLVLWISWYLLSYAHFGRLVLINTLLHLDHREAFSALLLGEKAISFVLNAGGILLCPVVIWIALAGAHRLRAFLVLFWLSWFPFYLWVSDWPALHVFLFALFFASGSLLLWEIAVQASGILRNLALAIRIRTLDHPSDWGSESGGKTQGSLTFASLMLLWFAGVLAACLVLFYSGSVRYVLLALPPVVLFWASRLEKRFTDAYFSRNLLGLTLAMNLAFGLWVAYGDYQFAEVYRRTAPELIQDHRDANQTVWFTGEWGFRYYLEREGGRILTKTAADAQPGDLIIKPFLASPWITLYDGNEHIELVEQRQARVPTRLRLLDFASRAGFYSTGWGLLPVSLSRGEPWEWFNVFRVRKAYEGPIPEQERLW